VKAPARHHLLLTVTGGIAAYKACDLVRELRRREWSVEVILTRAATAFVTAMTFEALSSRRAYTELLPGCTDGEIDHIGLGRRCDFHCIAPATADFLARAHAGLAGDLALATLLALPASVPVLFAPAMNGEMWAQPVTKRNVAGLRELGAGRYHFLEPVAKDLACGEYAVGGLPEPLEIADAVERLASKQASAGQNGS
jgi:phosphopantothenoylcysteine decarboxylase/phosphopantothenate--cysteine ligase